MDKEESIRALQQEYDLSEEFLRRVLREAEADHHDNLGQFLKHVLLVIHGEPCE